MTPSNIVFDFGAVLFQWQPHRLVAQHLPQHAADEAAARALAREMFHHGDWLSFDSGACSADEVVALLARRLALPSAALQALVDGIPRHLVPMAGSVAVLEALAQRRAERGDVRLFYLSNMPQPYARHLEREHAFLRYFEGGIFSGDVGLAKPDAAIFDALAARHAFAPADTVFIDDLAANVQAARQRGWHGIQFQDAAQLDATLQAHLTARG